MIGKVGKKKNEDIEDESSKQKTISKEIPLDYKDETPDKVRVEFEDEETAHDFATKQTKDSAEQTSDIDEHTSVEDVKKQVEDYEASKSGKLEYKDLKQTAEFIINMIDTALSTTLRFIAKDTAAQAYQMPAANKRLLTEQLELCLAKYQSKFKVEFMFFMGLVVLYAPFAIEAVKNRKKNLRVEKRIERQEKVVLNERQPNEPNFRHDPENPKELPKQEPIEKINVPVKTGRRRGRQPKII